MEEASDMLAARDLWPAAINSSVRHEPDVAERRPNGSDEDLNLTTGSLWLNIWQLSWSMLLFMI